MRHPRVRAVLREILPARDDRPVTFVTCDMVIDVLRCIGLVVGYEATEAESQVLDQDRVDRHVIASLVGRFGAPQPRGNVAKQTKRDAMMNTACVAFPHEPIRSDAEPNARARTECFNVARTAATDA